MKSKVDWQLINEFSKKKMKNGKKTLYKQNNKKINKKKHL